MFRVSEVNGGYSRYANIGVAMEIRIGVWSLVLSN
jgi:hypothetical protein